MTPPVTAMMIIVPPDSTAAVQGHFPGSHGFKREVRRALSEPDLLVANSAPTGR
jgi:hypothetical protein